VLHQQFVGHCCFRIGQRESFLGHAVRIPEREGSIECAAVEIPGRSGRS
jgi:hypothetical protein